MEILLMIYFHWRTERYYLGQCFVRLAHSPTMSNRRLATVLTSPAGLGDATLLGRS